jgi:hypothetical protein
VCGPLGINAVPDLPACCRANQGTDCLVCQARILVQEDSANRLIMFNKEEQQNEAFFNDRLQMPHFLCVLA